MKKSELLKNKGYWVAKIQLELFDALNQYMSQNNLNRTQLAKHLGVSKGYVTQVLNGDFNHRISKLVELALAIGKAPEISYIDLQELNREYEEGYKKVTWKVMVGDAQVQSISSSKNIAKSKELKVKVIDDINQPLVSNYS